jgi:Dolichyl-phosphate-mannose-protein mannosyltransferase
VKRERQSIAAGTVVALFAIALAAVSHTAFRVDEPNILAIARQIAAHPLDPYGFIINWTGTPQPAFHVLANPPLLPAWLAVVGRAAGWREVPLHLAVIPFALIFLFSLLSLARRFAPGCETAAALLAISSPAIALGAQVVMPDLAMTAMVTLAVAAAVRFSERRDAASLLVAALAAGCAPLIKYNGIVVVAVTAVWVFSRARRSAGWIIPLAPMVTLALWGIASARLYGAPHFVAISTMEGGAPVSPLPAMLAVLGLGVLPLAIPLARGGDRRIVSPSTMVAVAAGLVGGATAVPLGYRPLPAVLVGIATALAVVFLGDVVRRASTEAMLVVWILVPLALQFRVLFTSTRYLMPVVPAAILLTLRTRPVARWAIAAGVALVILLSAADIGTANSYRNFVGRPQWYAGHWGLQWYAEQAGARSFTGELRPGERLVVARNAFPHGQAGRLVAEETPRIALPLRTIGCAAGANFYSNAIGGCATYPILLPFGVSTEPVERFRTYAHAADQP